MRSLLFVALFFLPISILSQESNLVDCNKIFEEKKDELLAEIEKIDEQQQMLQALQAATQDILDKREALLREKEQDINNTMAKIEDKEANIKRMLEENRELLDAIKKSKDDKISETYAKMKDSKAAPILEALDKKEAAAILFSLKPQDMGKILAKMNPQNASDLTALLRIGPPFEVNASK